MICPTDKPSMAMFSKAINAARRRATKKDVDFDLLTKDVLDIYRDQNGLCYYSGIEMNVVKRSESLHDPYKMTIDCKEQGLGYVKENIVLCLYCVNSLKQKMPYSEMLTICQKVVSNHNAKN